MQYPISKSPIFLLFTPFLTCYESRSSVKKANRNLPSILPQQHHCNAQHWNSSVLSNRTSLDEQEPCSSCWAPKCAEFKDTHRCAWLNGSSWTSLTSVTPQYSGTAREVKPQEQIHPYLASHLKATSKHLWLASILHVISLLTHSFHTILTDVLSTKAIPAMRLCPEETRLHPVQVWSSQIMSKSFNSIRADTTACKHLWSLPTWVILI